jgi:hypothetical protein
MLYNIPAFDGVKGFLLEVARGKGRLRKVRFGSALPLLPFTYPLFLFSHRAESPISTAPLVRSSATGLPVASPTTPLLPPPPPPSLFKPSRQLPRRLSRLSRPRISIRPRS